MSQELHARKQVEQELSNGLEREVEVLRAFQESINKEFVAMNTTRPLQPSQSTFLFFLMAIVNM